MCGVGKGVRSVRGLGWASVELRALAGLVVGFSFFRVSWEGFGYLHRRYSLGSLIEGFEIITDHFPKLRVGHSLFPVECVGGLHLSHEFLWRRASGELDQDGSL